MTHNRQNQARRVTSRRDHSPRSTFLRTLRLTKSDVMRVTAAEAQLQSPGPVGPLLLVLRSYKVLRSCLGEFMGVWFKTTLL